jgi:hypothetical protein
MFVCLIMELPTLRALTEWLGYRITLLWTADSQNDETLGNLICVCTATKIESMSRFSCPCCRNVCTVYGAISHNDRARDLTKCTHNCTGYENYVGVSPHQRGTCVCVCLVMELTTLRALTERLGYRISLLWTVD